MTAIDEPASSKIGSLEDMEKQHILKALESAGGKISGQGGAAEILKISSSTLYAKLKKYDIKADCF